MTDSAACQMATPVRRCLSALIAALLVAMMAMSGAGSGGVDAAWAYTSSMSSAIAAGTVANIEGTDVIDSDNMLSLSKGNMSVVWGETGKAYGGTSFTNSSGFQMLALERDGRTSSWTVSGDICTLTFSDAATIDDTAIDVVVDVTKIVFGDWAYYKNGSMSSRARSADEYACFAYATASNFNTGCDFSSSDTDNPCLWESSVKVSFTTNVVWAESANGHVSGENVELDFFVVASDLDIHSAYESDSFLETMYFASADFDTPYYVYDSCALETATTSDGIWQKFYAPEGSSDVSGDASYTEHGAYASTDAADGTWKMAWLGAVAATTYEIYTVYDSDVDIEKSVENTTTGDSSSDAASPVSADRGDTVTWTIELDFPEWGVDTLNRFETLSITDPLPDGVTFVSAAIAIGATDSFPSGISASITASSPTASISACGATFSYADGIVTWEFSDNTYLKLIDSYAGQHIELTIVTTVDDDAAEDTYTNTVTLTADGVSVCDDAAAVVVANQTGSLKISKTVVDATSASADVQFTFKVTLSASGSYPYTTTGGESGTVASGGTLKIGAGETATVSGLPKGCTYTVSETSIPSGFTCTTPTTKARSGTITGGATATATFKNTYAATGSWTPQASKTLDGSTEDLAYYTFAFQVVDDDGSVVANGTSASDGSVSFDTNVAYTQDDVGTHSYTMYEVTGDEDDIDYDDAQVGIVVTVADEGGGTLSVQAAYDGSSTPPTFANETAAAEVALPATGQAGIAAAAAAGLALTGAGAWLVRRPHRRSNSRKLDA